MYNHILSIILFTPLVGALLLLFIPKESKNAIRWVANIFAALGFIVSLPLVPWFWAQRFEPGIKFAYEGGQWIQKIAPISGWKFVEGTPNNWIPSIGAGYVLGIDGISFLLIMLTTILGFISILSSWTAIQDRVKEYYAWFLLLQTGMLGVFMAQDLFLFFVFWEAMLVPMYLLIGIWGGPRKLYVVTALMTSFYMFRLMYLTFWSPKRMSHEAEHHVHESPRSMTVPLTILAICSIFAGFLGVPHALGGSNRFERFLEPVFVAEKHAPDTHAKAEGEQVEQAAPAQSKHADPMEYVLMLASIGAAALGLFMAGRAYSKADKSYKEPINTLAPPVYQTLLNKWYVDELYDYLFTGRRKLGPVRLGAMGAGEALWKFDATVIDGTVNGAGWMTRTFGKISSWWDKWIIDGVGVNGPAIIARGLSYPVRLVQWGLVQWYALVMVGGLVGFGIYFVRHLGR